MEPGDWIEWWNAHAAEVEAVCPRGWFLKLKPMSLGDSGVNRAALTSQNGACIVLKSLNVQFNRSDRYQRAWDDDFRQYCERKDSQQKDRERQWATGISALAEMLPKFARFLAKRINDIDQFEAPASEAAIVEVEKQIGVPIPCVLRQFLKCTSALELDGLSVGIGLIFPHPSLVQGKHGANNSFSIAEYCLEADGDQVLLEFNPDPEDDPPVYYYSHASGSQFARKLADKLSSWLDSLPGSPVFRRHDD